MRRFTMYRRGDLSATHTAVQANPADEAQFEGVVFTDGSCALRWRTAICSTSVWESFDDAMAIHGHPEYQSELVWHDRSETVPTKVVNGPPNRFTAAAWGVVLSALDLNQAVVSAGNNLAAVPDHFLGELHRCVWAYAQVHPEDDDAAYIKLWESTDEGRSFGLADAMRKSEP